MQEIQSLTVMIKVPDVRKAIDFYASIGFALAGTDEFHYGEGKVNWAMLLVAVEDLVAGLSGYPESPADIAHTLAIQ